MSWLRYIFWLLIYNSFAYGVTKKDQAFCKLVVLSHFCSITWQNKAIQWISKVSIVKVWIGTDPGVYGVNKKIWKWKTIKSYKCAHQCCISFPVILKFLQNAASKLLKKAQQFNISCIFSWFSFITMQRSVCVCVCVYVCVWQLDMFAQTN